MEVNIRLILFAAGMLIILLASLGGLRRLFGKRPVRGNFKDGRTAHKEPVVFSRRSLAMQSSRGSSKNKPLPAATTSQHDHWTEDWVSEVRVIQQEVPTAVVAKVPEKKVNPVGGPVFSSDLGLEAPLPPSVRPKTNVVAGASYMARNPVSLSSRSGVTAMKAPEAYAESTPVIKPLLQTRSEPMKAKSPVVQRASKIMALNIMAKPGDTFGGYALLQALLAVGLRFGRWQIFHRHEQPNGTGDVLFSVASAVEPGSFDLNRMEKFTCLGLTLFFNAATPPDPLAVFNLMVETARKLTDELKGELYDGRRQLLTPESVLAFRREIREYLETESLETSF